MPNGGASTGPGTSILEGEFGAGVLSNIFSSKLCYLTGSSLADGGGRTRVKQDEETIEPTSETEFLSPTRRGKTAQPPTSNSCVTRDSVTDSGAEDFSLGGDSGSADRGPRPF